MVSRSRYPVAEKQYSLSKEADCCCEPGVDRRRVGEVLACYNRYAEDLAKIYDNKIALFQEYLENHDSMSGEQAESYLRRRAAVEEDIMQVRLKYLPEFRKVLTGRETALFYQIDWRLDLMINLQLAQAPMINP